MDCCVFLCVSCIKVVIVLFCGSACLVYQSGHLFVLHQQDLGQCKYLCHCLEPKWVEYLTSVNLNLSLALLVCLVIAKISDG